MADYRKYRERDQARERERLEAERQQRVRMEDLIAPTTTGVTTVQLDGLVLLKIITHCKESMPDVVTGQLLGLDIDGRLEITSSFPLPTNTTESDIDNYQIEMMRMMRTVNVDNNTVGWYQSAYLGTFFDQVNIT